ncbi:MAG: hypothetical protein GX968_04890, partial [Tissierellia bacterium]|nr:hypothetical protein [Tissierellia bacterium]
MIVLIVIFLPLYMLLQITEINTFNKKIYLESYEKNRIEYISDKSLEELDTATESL